MIDKNISAEKIIFYPFPGNLGGGERALLDICNFLHESGIPHRVACYENACDVGSNASWPVIVEEIKPFNHGLGRAFALCRYLSFAYKNGSDRPLLIGLQAARHIAIFGGPPFNLLIWDTPAHHYTDTNKESRESNAIQWLQDRIIHLTTKIGVRRSATLNTPAAHNRDDLIGLYGRTAEIIYNGTPTLLNLSHNYKLLASDGNVRFLSVSRLEANKRVDWMIRTLAKSMKRTDRNGRINNWTLDIVGQGTKFDELQALSQSLNVGKNVIFHGFVSEDELIGAYNRADIFLMPAIQPFGLPALEALAQGLPVICHRQSGASDLLLDTPWAEVFDGGEENFEFAIRRILDRHCSGELQDVPLPDLPTQREWAEKVCRLCGWLD